MLTRVTLLLLALIVQASCLHSLPSELCHRIGTILASSDIGPRDVQSVLLANVPELSLALQNPLTIARTIYLSQPNDRTFTEHKMNYVPELLRGKTQTALDDLRDLVKSLDDVILKKHDPFNIIPFIQRIPSVQSPLSEKKCLDILAPLFKRYWDHVFDIIDETKICVNELNGLVLKVAIHDQNPFVIDQAIAMGAKVETNGYAALQWSAEKQLWWILRSCLQKVEMVKTDYYVPGLADVAAKGPLDLFDLFLKKLGNVTSTLLYPAINRALKVNRTEIIRFTLARIPFNHDIIRMIYFTAVCHGKTFLIPILERCGLNIHTFHDHALYKAILSRNFDVATYLIRRGLSLHRYDVNLMALASERRDLEMYLYIRRHSSRKFTPLNFRWRSPSQNILMW